MLGIGLSSMLSQDQDRFVSETQRIVINGIRSLRMLHSLKILWTLLMAMIMTAGKMMTATLLYMKLNLSQKCNSEANDPPFNVNRVDSVYFAIPTKQDCKETTA